MPCWSACTNDDALSGAAQYDATPQFLPPLSERKRSTPAAHTRSGSVGSTAITLACHPMLLRFDVLVDLHSSVVAEEGFVSRRWPYADGTAAVRTCAVHVPAAPSAVERKTACSPWSNVPPLCAASA